MKMKLRMTVNACVYVFVCFQEQEHTFTDCGWREWWGWEQKIRMCTQLHDVFTIHKYKVVGCLLLLSPLYAMVSWCKDSVWQYAATITLAWAYSSLTYTHSAVVFLVFLFVFFVYFFTNVNGNKIRFNADLFYWTKQNQHNQSLSLKVN